MQARQPFPARPAASGLAAAQASGPLPIGPHPSGPYPIGPHPSGRYPIGSHPSGPGQGSSRSDPRTAVASSGGAHAAGAHPPGARAAGTHSAGAGGAEPAVRGAAEFTRRISRDGSTGFLAEPGRYCLYASLACPWSQRALIVRRLLGLERVIGLTLTDPVPAGNGWHFPAATAGRDPLTGARYLSELYRATDPGYAGRVSLPLLWDARAGRIVTNDFTQISVQLETEFSAFWRPGAPDLYPAAHRREIDAIAALVHHAVNNGVYKAGLATSQAAYEEAFDALFTALDALEERLGRRRFLLGPEITEADVRLFPTLVRFDAVYYLLYKCNLHRLADYQHLWNYARDLYQRPGFGDTTDFVQIKRHYYQTQLWINPTGIVPKGPYVSWLAPHGRDRPQGLG